MSITAPPRPAAPQVSSRLPGPVRDRRPALAALALLLVLGGALTSALIAYRSGDRVDVLVALADVEVGQVMGRGDFAVARVAADGAGSIQAEALPSFVGTTATGRIPAGTMLTSRMFLAAGDVTPAGSVLVGVVLSPVQRPAQELQPGDVVRVFLVPRESGDQVLGTVLAQAVLVADVGASAGGETTRLSLLVPEADAREIVTAAATGSLAVTELAPGTRPAVAFRTQ